MRYGNDFPLNGIKYHERKTKMSEDEKLAEMKAFWNPGKRMVCNMGKPAKRIAGIGKTLWIRVSYFWMQRS